MGFYTLITKVLRLIALVLAVASAPALAAAASQVEDTAGREKVAPGAPPPAGETRARRDRLVRLLEARLPSGHRGAFFLRGAEDDQEGEFRQGSSFYYLTGLGEPGASLVLYLGGEAPRERLYLPDADEMRERWIGPALAAGRTDPSSGEPDARRKAAVEASGFRGEGFSGVAPADRLVEDVVEWLGRRGTLFLAQAQASPPDGTPVPEPGILPPGLEGKLRRLAPADGEITELRLVKSAWEIARIRRAAEITCRAHEEALEALRPGIPEYVLEAAIEHAFTSAGARYAAFPAIVGSGPNSCILHYYLNGRTVGEDEVVLIDIGAEVGRYASDVTRTLPSSGRFTDFQRKVHDAVLRAQEAGLARAAPGATLRTIDDAVREVLREAGLDEHIMHGCCHFVGLDVHDVGGRDVPLRPGMVLTVEPGVYIASESVGVRIEDTVLITESGNEVLSACAPKAAGELEKLMAAARQGAAAKSGISPASPVSPRR